MDDRILRVASEVYSAPKVYALLLGSGISHAARIPTGQQLMDKLIGKIAHLKKAAILGQPNEWYEKHFSEKPTYGSVIERLGRNPADRSNLIRPYFERQLGDEAEVKAPTRAHQAVARLIKEGYIQVVLTTNFDRLLEQALEAQGISPLVIRTPQDAANSAPLQHLPVTIIKLHGDYQDIGILNTADELNEYDPAINKLLDKVLSEWGLIICGWSAESDTALQSAFARAPQSPYSTHWITYQGDMKPEAIAIRDSRGAEQIDTMGADAFFDELEQNVMALKSLDSIHEISPMVAAERVRRLLSANDLISLETLLNTELEEAYQRFNNPEFKEQIRSLCPDWNQIVDCVQIASKKYFEVLETPLHMVATLTWNGQGILDSVLALTISRWMEGPASQIYFASERLPILLLIYTAGIAAVERGRWQYLQATLSDPFVSKRSHDDYPSFLVRLFEETYRQYPPDGGQILSLGKQLNPVLRTVFQSPLIASDERYNQVFDLYELMLNLAYLASPEREGDTKWMPNHETFLRNRSWDYIAQYLGKASGLGDKWGLINVEPFYGTDFEELLKRYQQAIEDRKQYLSPQSRRIPDFSSFYKPFRPEV